MATIELIKRITIENRATGVQETVAGVNAVSAALGNAAVKGNEAAVVTDLAARRTLSSAAAYEKQTRSVVDGAAAQDRIAKAIKIADSALAQGVITQTDHARRVDLITQKYSQVTQGVTGFGSALGTAREMLGTFGIALSIGAFVQFGRSLFEATAGLENQAKTLGISTDALQAYHAAAVLSGAGADVGDTAIRRLTRSIGDANEGNKALQKSFHDLLGVSSEMVGGTESWLPKVANSLLAIADANKRAAFETALFGRAGQDVEAVLRRWADPEIIAHMKELNLIIGEDLVKRAHAADVALETMWTRFKIGAVEAVDAAMKVAKMLGDLALFGKGTAFKDIAKMLEPPRDVRTSGIPFASAGNAPPGSDKKWDIEKNSALDAFLAKQTLANELAKDTVELRKIDTALIEAATAKLEAQAKAENVANTEHVSSVAQAYKILGDTLATRVTMNVLQEQANVMSTEWNKTITDALAKTGGIVGWNQNLLDLNEKTRDAMKEQSLTHTGILATQIKELSIMAEESDKTKFAGENAIAQLEEQVRLAGLSREARQAELTVMRELHARGVVLNDDQAEYIASLEQTLEETKRWREQVDQTSRSFENMFTHVLETGKFKFTDLTTFIKDAFARMLAQMATLAIEEPIIVPMVTSMKSVIGSLFSGGGGIGSLLGFGGGSDAAWGFPGSVNITPAIGSGIFGSGVGLGALAGGALGGLGIGSLLSSFTGGNLTGSSIGGGIGGVIGSIIPGIGTIIGGLAGSLLGGLFGNNKPSNFTGYANFGPDYSLAGGSAGDKPNSATIAASQQAGTAIAAAAKSLEAAGITLTAGVNHLEIGQRDQSSLVLAGGQRVNVGAVGDVQAAVTGTISYLLGGASSSNPNVQKVLDFYKGTGGLNAANADAILASVGAVSGFDTANQAAIDQMTNPVLAAWNNLMKTEQASLDQARQFGLDTTLLERRNRLEQAAFVANLNAQQRTALEGLVDVATELALKIADLKTSTLSSIDALLSASAALAQARSAVIASSALDPVSKLNIARSQFQTGAAGAAAGDPAALANLAKLAQDFTSASLAGSGNAQSYRRDLTMISEALGSGPAYDIQTGILEAIKANLSQTTMDTVLLQQQLAALGQVGDLVGAGNGSIVQQLQLLIQLQAQLAAAPAAVSASTLAASQAAVIPAVPPTVTQLAQELGPTDQLWKGHNTPLMDIQQSIILGNPVSIGGSRGLTALGVSQTEIDRLRQYGVNVYGSGGAFAGGWRVVGENGPELERTGPSRIYSNAQSKSLVDNSGVVSAVDKLRSEVAQLRQATAETASNTRALESFFRRISEDGNSITVTVAA
jgi:hypothetical protein